MWVKDVLLWILPALMIASGVVFSQLPGFVEKLNQPLYDRKYKGWTWFDLAAFTAAHEPARNGHRKADFAITPDGTIWVAGGEAGLSGVHYYDGSQWQHINGKYSDLAVGPNGQVWPAPINSWKVEAFDGRQWKTYRMRGMDPELSYPQVEIDANGRVWYVTDTSLDRTWWVKDTSSETWLGRLAITGGAISTGMSVDAPKAGGGWFNSIDADPQGRLWVSVHPSPDGLPSPDTGLHLFDGRAWQRIEVPRGEPVKRTVFDGQGDAWILTEGGSVMHQAGDGWETVIDAPSGPDLDGLFVDPRGRLWVWARNELRFLEGGKWAALTPRNSGIGGHETTWLFGMLANKHDVAWLFGMVVDRQDRAWIGTSKGVSMVQVQDIQPLSDAEVQAYEAGQSWQRLAHGLWWVVPSVFALLWLASALGALPAVWMAALLGMGSTLLGLMDTAFVLPGLLGMYVGMLCGLFSGVPGESQEWTWAMSGPMRFAYYGWVFGWLVGLWLLR